MSTTHHVVEGQTSPYDIDLKDDGLTPDGVLGGTIDLIIKNADGVQIPLTGNVTIQDAANWRVRVNPDSTDFSTPGIYRGRIKVTDSGSKVAYFPNSTWDVWIIHEEA